MKSSSNGNIRLGSRRCSKTCLAGIFGVLIVAAILLASNYLHITRFIHTSTEEIDISTGHVREREYWLTFHVSEAIRDTWISRNRTNLATSADWKLSTSFPLFSRVSPHFAYHGAVVQTVMLDELDDLINITPAAKTHIADQILFHWRTDSSDNAAGVYVQRLSAFVMDSINAGAQSISIDDLP